MHSTLRFVCFQQQDVKSMMQNGSGNKFLMMRNAESCCILLGVKVVQERIRVGCRIQNYFMTKLCTNSVRIVGVMDWLNDPWPVLHVWWCTIH